MRLIISILEAFESLSANKLRSALTVLGVVIGVAAVISMLSIGKGAQAAITSQIESIGTNLIYVSPGSTRSNGVMSASGSAGTLTMDDAKSLESLPNVVAVAPEANGRAQLAYMGNNLNTRLVGVTHAYATVRGLSLTAGTFITESNQISHASVIVLGSSVAETLFGSTDAAVGKSVKVNGLPFRVIGVLASKGSTGFMNQDDQVFVPLSTAQTRLVGSSNFRGALVISQINVKAADTSAVDEVVNAITATIRARHNTIAGSDDFTVSSQQDSIDTATSVTDTLSLFLGGIAGISLAVGGIGIMNIMLTTVSERTREIGLRKAIGARRRDILTQFLIESTVLSLLGGVLGVAVGWAIASLMGQVQLSGTTITPQVSLDSVLMATLFSMAIGLFFGIYPASRAARLLPVEALRHE
ncbi:MAG TPA: ABC transporter permease [Anaerolineaceae bacterium]|nr:ABC transporter permease [Anaerolineaceae bacterium]HPN54041.1 ABC transporter permease [Anaerolineaceae bacterium]